MRPKITLYTYMTNPKHPESAIDEVDAVDLLQQMYHAGVDPSDKVVAAAHRQLNPDPNHTHYFSVECYQGRMRISARLKSQ